MTNKSIMKHKQQDLVDDEIDWTSQELQEWVNAGLVPKELLEDSKKIELIKYLKTNKQILNNHYRKNSEENHYIAIIPPPTEWHKAPDIVVREKETGEIVSILEMAATYELCKEVWLQVKAKELPDWKKETSDAWKLDKEQREIFKTALQKLGSESPLSRRDIIILIEEIKKNKRKSTKYRQSGHYVDEKLKYIKPNQQYNLFDLISPETRQKIENSRIEIKAEGIKLTYPEDKMINTLNLILHEKSQNKNPNKDDFYIGNAKPIIIPYGNNPEQKAPVLRFKPKELYKAYMGKDNYSGADILFINKILHQVEAKKFLIKYDRIKKIKKGKKEAILTDRIEEFASLIKILVFYPNLSVDEKKKLDNGDMTVWKNNGEIIIALNPIFTDQIDTKFIEYPIDANRRLVIAAGGHKKVTSSTSTLMEYLLREISAKRYHPQINEDNLQCMLGLENYAKEKRKKRLRDRIEKDIQTMINMGIVLSYEKQPNVSGNLKYMFRLNKDYE